MNHKQPINQGCTAHTHTHTMQTALPVYVCYVTRNYPQLSANFAPTRKTTLNLPSFYSLLFYLFLLLSLIICGARCAAAYDLRCVRPTLATIRRAQCLRMRSVSRTCALIHPCRLAVTNFVMHESSGANELCALWKTKAFVCFPVNGPLRERALTPAKEQCCQLSSYSAKLKIC